MSGLRPSGLVEVPSEVRALRAQVAVRAVVLLLARSLPALAAALLPPTPVQAQ